MACSRERDLLIDTFEHHCRRADERKRFETEMFGILRDVTHVTLIITQMHEGRKVELTRKEWFC